MANRRLHDILSRTTAVRRQLTAIDSMRLRALLDAPRTWGFGSEVYRDRLRQLLETADIVAPEDIPEDVVTMNSQVRLRNDDHDIETDLFLVFPADARGSDFQRPKLSILTQIGLSMLGRKAGDTINGRLRIVKLPYQPEAAGDFNL